MDKETKPKEVVLGCFVAVLCMVFLIVSLYFWYYLDEKPKIHQPDINYPILEDRIKVLEKKVESLEKGRKQCQKN